MYQVIYSKQALRALKAMPKNTAALIRNKISALSLDPFDAPGVKKLVGGEGYRLRVGDWRVLYYLDGNRLWVVVTKIATRGEVYK